MKSEDLILSLSITVVNENSIVRKSCSESSAILRILNPSKTVYEGRAMYEGWYYVEEFNGWIRHEDVKVEEVMAPYDPVSNMTFEADIVKFSNGLSPEMILDALRKIGVPSDIVYHHDNERMVVLFDMLTEYYKIIDKFHEISDSLDGLLGIPSIPNGSWGKSLVVDDSNKATWANVNWANIINKPVSGILVVVDTIAGLNALTSPRADVLYYVLSENNTFYYIKESDTFASTTHNIELIIHDLNDIVGSFDGRIVDMEAEVSRLSAIVEELNGNYNVYIDKKMAELVGLDSQNYGSTKGMVIHRVSDHEVNNLVNTLNSKINIITTFDTGDMYLSNNSQSSKKVTKLTDVVIENTLTDIISSGVISGTKLYVARNTGTLYFYNNGNFVQISGGDGGSGGGGDTTPIFGLVQMDCTNDSSSVTIGDSIPYSINNYRISAISSAQCPSRIVFSINSYDDLGRPIKKLLELQFSDENGDYRLAKTPLYENVYVGGRLEVYQGGDISPKYINMNNTPIQFKGVGKPTTITCLTSGSFMLEFLYPQNTAATLALASDEVEDMISHYGKHKSYISCEKELYDTIFNTKEGSRIELSPDSHILLDSTRKYIWDKHVEIVGNGATVDTSTNVDGLVFLSGVTMNDTVLFKGAGMGEAIVDDIKNVDINILSFRNRTLTASTPMGSRTIIENCSILGDINVATGGIYSSMILVGGGITKVDNTKIDNTHIFEDNNTLSDDVKPVKPDELEPILDGLKCWVDARDGSNEFMNITLPDKSGNSNSMDVINALYTDVNGFNGKALIIDNSHLAATPDANASMCHIAGISAHSDRSYTLQIHFKYMGVPNVVGDRINKTILGGASDISHINDFSLEDNRLWRRGDGPIFSNNNMIIPDTDYKITIIYNDVIDDGHIGTRLYINNELIAREITGGPIGNNGISIGSFGIGDTLGKAIQSVNMHLYNFRLYNRALKDSELDINIQYDSSIDREVESGDVFTVVQNDVPANIILNNSRIIGNGTSFILDVSRGNYINKVSNTDMDTVRMAICGDSNNIIESCNINDTVISSAFNKIIYSTSGTNVTNINGLNMINSIIYAGSGDITGYNFNDINMNSSNIMFFNGPGICAIHKIDMALYDDINISYDEYNVKYKTMLSKPPTHANDIIQNVNLSNISCGNGASSIVFETPIFNLSIDKVMSNATYADNINKINSLEFIFRTSKYFRNGNAYDDNQYETVPGAGAYIKSADGSYSISRCIVSGVTGASIENDGNVSFDLINVVNNNAILSKNATPIVLPINKSLRFANSGVTVIYDKTINVEGIIDMAILDLANSRGDIIFESNNVDFSEVGEHLTDKTVVIDKIVILGNISHNPERLSATVINNNFNEGNIIVASSNAILDNIFAHTNINISKELGARIPRLSNRCPFGETVKDASSYTKSRITNILIRGKTYSGETPAGNANAKPDGNVDYKVIATDGAISHSIILTAPPLRGNAGYADTIEEKNGKMYHIIRVSPSGSELTTPIETVISLGSAQIITDNMKGVISVSVDMATYKPDLAVSFPNTLDKHIYRIGHQIGDLEDDMEIIVDRVDELEDRVDKLEDKVTDLDDEVTDLEDDKIDWDKIEVIEREIGDLELLSQNAVIAVDPTRFDNAYYVSRINDLYRVLDLVNRAKITTYHDTPGIDGRMSAVNIAKLKKAEADVIALENFTRKMVSHAAVRAILLDAVSSKNVTPPLSEADILLAQLQARIDALRIIFANGVYAVTLI